MRSLGVLSAALALVLVLAVAAAAALAAAEKLTATEIREALTGNTVDGIWGGKHYRSYFAPNGSTVYKPKGFPPDQGRWKVDETKDQYCSWWPRSGWGCYDVYREGDRIIQFELATALSGIRQQGAGYFHSGPFARRFAEAAHLAGQPLSAEPFTNYLEQKLLPIYGVA